jgi:hypothetical protein
MWRCGYDDVAVTPTPVHQEESLISASGDIITLITSMNYLFFRNKFPSPKKLQWPVPLD